MELAQYVRGGSEQEGRPRSAAIRAAVAAEVLRGFQLHAGEEPARGLAAVVVQRGGVDSLGVLRVDDGGAGEAPGPVAGLEAHLGLVAAPRAVGHADDGLAARGHAQAHGQVHVVDEVLLRVVPHRGGVPATQGRRELCSGVCGEEELSGGAVAPQPRSCRLTQKRLLVSHTFAG